MSRFLGSAGRRELVSCSVGKLLDERWVQVVDGLVRPLGVEPMDPLQGVDIDVLSVAPRPIRIDQLGLEESMPASMGRSVNANDVFWLPASV